MNPTEDAGKSVFHGKLFTVKNISKVLPDGSDKVYELIDIQNAITVLPIDDENNVYCVEQYRIGADQSLLELPAGKIEKGEDPLVAARRELREEIGMDANEIIHVGNFYMSPGYANEYMYCYLARGLFQSRLDPDADEFINLVKIPLEKLDAMVAAGEIEDSKTLAVLSLARSKIK